MFFDVKTLFLLTMQVEALLGLLLLLAWTQNMRVRAVAWWGAAHFMRSVSIALYGLAGSTSDLISIDLAGALLFTSYGVTWTGVRVFNGREPLPGSLAAGAIVWMIASQFSAFTATLELRAILSGLIITGFSWLSAYEFWRGRDESLVSRWPAIMLLSAHGLLFLTRTPLTSMLQGDKLTHEFSSAWLSVLSPEALLFAISVAFVLLAMAKERAELSLRAAAMVDPLTGVANRRAFVQDTERIFRRQVEHARPVAVFLIDLDHFKSVNDRFGHAAGDRVLRLFAKVCTENLRSTDLVGRLGGEEFAVLLADATRDNAFLVAERIRRAFANAATVVEEHKLSATISIGVAVIQDPQQNLNALVEEADQALYRAKESGRNRVALAPLKEAEASGAAAQPQIDGTAVAA